MSCLLPWQHTVSVCRTTLFSDEPPKPKSTVNTSAPPPATTSTSKKSSQPSKLIDLGAAATFAGTEKKTVPTQQTTLQQQQQQQQVRGGDPFMDVFGEFSQATAPAVQTQKTTQGGCRLLEWFIVIITCLSRSSTLQEDSLTLAHSNLPQLSNRHQSHHSPSLLTLGHLNSSPSSLTLGPSRVLQQTIPHSSQRWVLLDLGGVDMILCVCV